MTAEQMLARVRVVLCRTSHPGNIGAAARAMKTMGLSDLWLVNPKIFPSDEARARATGAVDVVEAAHCVDSLPQALVGCPLALGFSARVRDLAPALSSVHDTLHDILPHMADAPLALVFGNESHGLSNEELLCCQRQVFIPTNPDFASLNLGAAVQVAAYECRLALLGEHHTGRRREGTPSSSRRATVDEIEGLVAHFQAVMTTTGFYNPAQPGRLLPRLRRLFAHANLETSEVNILRGILASTQNHTTFGHPTPQSPEKTTDRRL